MSRCSSLDRADVIIGAALWAGTWAYLAAWPHDLSVYDESLYLYESVRILHGDVMYRDFYEMVTPLSYYLMALVFRIFGPSIEVARTTMAVAHGAIAVLVYLLSRRLGARRGLAAVAGVAPLVVAFPAFPQASPHWFGALLTIGLAAVLVLRPPPRSTRWWLVPGLVVGLLIATQQQKGIVVGAVLALWLAIEVRLDARARWLPRLVGTVGWFAAGLALVVVPLLIVLPLVAGVGPVVEALVRPYGGYYYANSWLELWGWGLWLPAWQVYFLRALPLTLALGLAGAYRAARQAEDPRPLVRMTVVAAAGLMSVAYKPDACHLAVATPGPLVLLALGGEWALDAVERLTSRAWLVTALAAGLATAALGLELAQQLIATARGNPASYESAFGRLDFPDANYGAFADRLVAMFRQTGTDEIFAYPSDAGIYLWTGTRNPTRFQLLLRDYNTPDQFSEVIATLTARNVRYLVVSPRVLKNPKRDPIVLYARQLYRQVETGGTYWVFERLPDGQRPPTS